MKIVVTGGSGKAGRVCAADLKQHGHDVTIVDRAPPTDGQRPFLLADLTDYGQVVDALSGADAVAHLAAIPAPRIYPNAHTFRNNALTDYHIFEAARQLGIKNVVWASSETVLGLPFDTPPPYVPVDEEVPPRPESAYSLAKLVSETMAQQFCRWDPDLKMIGLRFSNVINPDEYTAFPSFDDDIERRRWNLWGYIDVRDAAQAVRLALEAPLKGADVFIIANSDSVMTRPSADLMAARFPDVPFKHEVTGNETLLSNAKARRILGFEPQHSWRDKA